MKAQEKIDHEKKYYYQEMNKVSQALEATHNAKFNLEKAKKKYADVEFNRNWRNWVYIKYDKIFENVIKKENFKNNKYDDLKVFQNIINLSDEYLNLFSVSKDVIDKFEPKNLNDLTEIFAVGKDSSRYGSFLSTYKCNTDVPDFIKRFVKNSNNKILFEEQIRNILYKIFDRKKEAKWVMSTFWDIRYNYFWIYDFDEFKKIADGNFSFLNYIRKEHLNAYTHHFKIPCSGIKNKLSEKNINEKDADKIANMIVLGSLVACRRKKAVQSAKYLYLISELALKCSDYERKFGN